MESHQDWTPVLLTGKKPISASQTKYTIENKKSDEEKSRSAKNFALENTDDVVSVPTLPAALCQEIIKARNAKKWTQKEVAAKLNIQQALYASYENGKAIPDHQLLQRIAKVLETKFENKIVKNKSA